MWELPLIQGLMLCERVDVDPATGLPTLVRRFTRVRRDRFPTGPVGFSVFAVLSNGFGDIPLTLLIGDPAADRHLKELRTVLRFADRLREVPFHVAVENVSFPRPGVYEVSLYAADEPLASYPLQVARRTGGGTP